MRGHDIALWSGIAAFFASLLATGILDLVSPGHGWEFLGAIIVAIVTAGGVYAKQRLDDAKKEREKAEGK